MAIFLTVVLIVVTAIGLFALVRYQRTPSRARKAARRETLHYGNGGSLAGLQKNSFFRGG